MSQPSRVCWCYRDENTFSWMNLDERFAIICEDFFQRGDRSNFEIQIADGRILLVSLEYMSAVEALSQVSIPLQRNEHGTSQYQHDWEYEEHRGHWISYHIQASAHIEAAMTAGFRKTAICAGHDQYLIDIHRHFQTNVRTGFRRRNRRVPNNSISFAPTNQQQQHEEENGTHCTEEAQRLGLSCVICMDHFDASSEAISFSACLSQQNQTLSHAFHPHCINTWLKSGGGRCPVCRASLHIMTGTQPKNGTMSDELLHHSLPGFPSALTRRIRYYFPDGVQGPEHPNPGCMYLGTTRIAYLPTTPEGNLAFRLLKLAFSRRLIFRVGTSISTGIDNTVIWAGIHHKTSQTPGPFGFPDPNYLTILFDELKSNGITKDDDPGPSS
mmetsp:Transcript_2315/g.3688  ORF Transcript_2315/g.3688 Transcript_2315/m.3688 type:complete len:384 (-) Transcript_2315:348-1499(-)